VPRADHQQVGVLRVGDATQGVRGREVGLDADERLGGKLVAEGAQVVLERVSPAGIAVGERKRGVVVHADQDKACARRRRDGVCERHRAAAALSPVASCDDRAVHDAS
jgi:hypothetical protein